MLQNFLACMDLRLYSLGLAQWLLYLQNHGVITLRMFRFIYHYLYFVECCASFGNKLRFLNL